MADNHAKAKDSGSSSEDDEEEAEHYTNYINDETTQHHRNLTTKLVLRVHIASLPRYGIRKILPDTYVEVTSIHAPSSGGSSSSLSTTSAKAVALQRTHCGRTEMSVLDSFVLCLSFLFLSVFVFSLRQNCLSALSTLSQNLQELRPEIHDNFSTHLRIRIPVVLEP